MMIISAVFFLTAFAYAMIGFGGGSTYTAVLALSGMPHRLIPAISLVCNIIVVTGGICRFFRAGHIKLEHVWPWLLFSVPAAWLGSMVILKEKEFVFLLGVCLFASGLWLTLGPTWSQKADLPKHQTFLKTISLSRFGTPAVFGAFLGLLGGMTGIGGGVFLAPVLHFLRWGNPKEIAGICALFIFANSCSGLLGHVSRLYREGEVHILLNYWPLMIAVFVGGALGSWIGVFKLNAQYITRLTGGLIILISVKLLMRWWNLN